MGMDSFLYKLVYLLHLSTVVVGFGSSFVYPALASRARKMERPQGFALTRASLALARPLTLYPVIAAGLFGAVLVVLSDEIYKFSQTWISIAFLLWFIGLGVSIFLHLPNLKAMDGLQEQLVSGQVKGGPGGPPPEVAELQARGKRAGMYGGILHLVWALLMIDMVWKPGF
jgi:hypothetical protein